MTQPSKLRFRVRAFNLTGVAESVDTDFNNVIAALEFISKEWDLNLFLFDLMSSGFLMADDKSKMVMLLGVHPRGTEDLITHPLISRQMGAPTPPEATVG